ncbi:MAG: hypothetical protein IPF44_11590 [Betaproteobacteria bacterium]|nr:hypothetical protein [Betaproteobacteria bacterium]
MKVSWRYDYFLAFGNLCNFYPRAADDDAGFNHCRLYRLRTSGCGRKAQLVEPVIPKVRPSGRQLMASRPISLKKRFYLVSRLEEVAFIDTASGGVLCRIRPGQGAVPAADSGFVAGSAVGQAPVPWNGSAPLLVSLPSKKPLMPRRPWEAIENQVTARFFGGFDDRFAKNVAGCCRSAALDAGISAHFSTSPRNSGLLVSQLPAKFSGVVGSIRAPSPK